MPKQNPQKISDARVSTSRARVRSAFTLGSLVWLPAGIAATSVLRGFGLPVEPQAWLSLIVIAPCGLPLALACRRLRRLGYPAAAWAAMAVLGSATVGASLFAGLLGPVAIAVYAVVLSLPVWLVCRLLGRRRPGLGLQGLKPRRNRERYPRGRLNRAPRRRTC